MKIAKSLRCKIRSGDLETVLNIKLFLMKHW